MTSVFLENTRMIKKIKKPVPPKKPHKPIEPNKPQEFLPANPFQADLDNFTSLKDLLDKIGNTDPLTVKFEIECHTDQDDYYADCNHKVYWPNPEMYRNPSYDRLMEIYTKAMEKFNVATAEYDQKMETYNQKYKEYKEKYKEYRRQELENELSKLK